MADRVDDVMELLNHLAQVKEMKATFGHAKWGAVLAGASAFLGGTIAGPTGIVVGGAIGGLLGAWMSSGQFKPVPQILLELSPTERKKLCEEALGVIRNLDWTDARHLIALVMKNDFVQEKLIEVLHNYLHKWLGAKIEY
ncbi:CS012 protein, partial [Campylorhamphus procurvoides]|nr:CS012 protein [Campylorhamphus procurvoides]